MATIAVINNKGGVGKSTIAIHLAWYFAKKHKTLLIDGDKNQTVTNWWNRAANFEFLCSKFNEVQDLSEFKFAIIDTPAREAELETLSQCDLIIIPIIPDIISLEPSVAVANALPNSKILINLAPSLPSKEGAIAQRDLMEGGFDVFGTIIRRSAGFPKAAYSGKVIAQLGTRFDRMAKDINKFCFEVEEALVNGN